jgi:hypothetical protein
MSNVINLFVTCAQRKKYPVVSEMKLSSFPSFDTIEDLSTAWIERLLNQRIGMVKAGNLYSGDQWYVIRSLKAQTDNSPTILKIYIISAGYGLVSFDSPLIPYAATFAAGHKDSILSHCSISNAKVTRSIWWRLLAEWCGPERNQPRTMRQVVEINLEARNIIVASGTYLDAISDELKEVVEHSNPKSLGIISASAPQKDWLKPYLFPCDVRLRPLVGGSNHSLNIRLAKWMILKKFDGNSLDFNQIRTWLSNHLKTVDKIESPKRENMPDDDIMNFILEKINYNHKLRPTPLLREFREAGFACEQKRFASLFMKVSKEIMNNG